MDRRERQAWRRDLHTFTMERNCGAQVIPTNGEDEVFLDARDDHHVPRNVLNLKAGRQIKDDSEE